MPGIAGSLAALAVPRGDQRRSAENVAAGSTPGHIEPMKGVGMGMPSVTTQDAWQAARSQLQVKEDALLEARDAVVAERRRLPMVEVERNYAFKGRAGQVGLLDMFDGRRQLLLYRFWFIPGEEPCPG